MRPEDFIAKVRPVIDAALPSGCERAKRLILAHAALESGWGQAKAFQLGSNLFNITRLPTDIRPVIVSGDLEYPGDGKGPKRIVQRFAAYLSLGASLEHYLKFINGPRYRPALAELLAGDIKFIETLGRGRYFTLPLEEYQKRFASTLAAVERVLDASPRA